MLSEIPCFGIKLPTYRKIAYTYANRIEEK